MNPRRFLQIIAAATLAASLGCSARPSDPLMSLDAFPTVLYVGKEMTRADMARIHPGCAKYLAALGAASKAPLLERVRGTWPAYSPDFMNEDAPWTAGPAVRWGPYRAYLLTKGKRHNQVILRVPDGRYHLLVLDVMDDLGGRIDIFTGQGQLVLNYHAEESGTGHCTVDESFVLDAAGVPRRVNSEEAIQAALRKVLPEGHTIQHGGGWDLPRLTYSMLVYKPREGGPHPTGGRVWLAFDLVGDRLVLRKYCYDPEFNPVELRDDDPAWTAPPKWKPWSDILSEADN